MAIERVGIVGLGTMGRPMGQRMLQAGYKVVGFDPDEAARRRAREEYGLEPLASAADVARGSDLVLVLVGFEKQVEAVVFGPGGILDGAREGLVLAIGSTIAPSYAQDLARRVEHRGIRLLDMPITRGEVAARAGSLLIIGGGDPDTFEACRPLMATIASDIFHLGPFGSGQVGKMANNMILWACIAINDEALRFGEAMGVDQESLRAALAPSSGSNWALIERADLRQLTWAEKDMAIAQNEADKLRFCIPVCGLVKEVIKNIKVERDYPTPTL